MTDPAPTPPNPEPTPAQPKQTRGDVDKTILADITLAEDVAAAASDPDHAPQLAAEELDANAAANLLAGAKDARELVGKVVAAKKARLAATKTEQEACASLMGCLRDLQQRAKRRFPVGDPKRAAYGINKKNFGADRESLEQDAENIITQAGGDALPGLKPEKLAAASAALAAWKKADEAQHKAEEDQARRLNELNDTVAKVNAQRREIQLTADTAWPHTDKANAPVRRSFQIPVNQPVAK
jgi:hypothetical protein